MNNFNLLDELIPEISSDVVFVTGDFSFVPRMRLGKKNDALEIIFKKILEKSSNATIVFPLASLNLCNTSIPFNSLKTPSYEMGAFSEFLRKKDNSLRSLHPFWSVGAIGPLAEKLTKNISPHAYAANSIWDRLCNFRAKQITIGKKVSDAVTTIHHCECISGVPYRYTKEFSHPIEQESGLIEEKLFYLSVFYRNLNAKKRIRRNQHFFKSLNSGIIENKKINE